MTYIKDPHDNDVPAIVDLIKKVAGKTEAPVTSTFVDAGYTNANDQAGSGTGEMAASDVVIEDAGTYFAGTDVEAALQELGSDIAGMAFYWDRTGTVLSPANAGDTVEASSTSDASYNGTIIGTATGQSGAGVRGVATGADGYSGAKGVGGFHTHDTVVGYGVYGATSSSDNEAYGGYFNRSYLGTWGDVAESATSPLATAPETGYVRITASDEGRLYAFDSSGNRHDLNDLTPHFFPGWTAAQNSATGSTWDDEKYPSGAMGAATITASQSANFDFTNEGALASYGRWSWTGNIVNAGGYLVLNQSQVAVWTPFGRQGDPNDNCRVYVQARIRVNKTANFDNVYLVINDVTTADAFANTAKSADQLGSMSDATWYIATLSATGTDVGGWNECLRAGVWAQGASEVVMEEEAITFDVDWIKVYMFAN